MTKVDKFDILGMAESFGGEQGLLLRNFIKSSGIEYRNQYIVVSFLGEKTILRYDGSKTNEKGICVVTPLGEVLLSTYINQKALDPNKIIPEEHQKIYSQQPYPCLFAHILLKSAHSGQIPSESFKSADDALKSISTPIITDRTNIPANNFPRNGVIYNLAYKNLDTKILGSKKHPSDYVRVFLQEGNVLNASSLIIRNYGQKTGGLYAYNESSKLEQTLATYFENRGIYCTNPQHCAEFLASVINQRYAPRTYPTLTEALADKAPPGEFVQDAAVLLDPDKTRIMQRKELG